MAFQVPLDGLLMPCRLASQYLLTRGFGVLMQRREARRLFREIDVDHSEQISFSELQR